MAASRTANKAERFSGVGKKRVKVKFSIEFSQFFAVKETVLIIAKRVGKVKDNSLYATA